MTELLSQDDFTANLSKVYNFKVLTMPARKIRKEDDAKFSLRIPRNIREWLEKKAENQSINAYILAVLKKEKAQDERTVTTDTST